MSPVLFSNVIRQTFVNQFKHGIRAFSTTRSVVSSHSDINNYDTCSSYFKLREAKYKIILSEDDTYQFKSELATKQMKNLSAMNSSDWKKDSHLFGLIDNSFFLFAKQAQHSSILKQSSLSFFASLFADRQGTMVNLTEDSVISSLLMNLYSGYNRVAIDPSYYSSYESIVRLNCIGSRVFPAVLSDVDAIQTIFYNVILPKGYDIPSFSRTNQSQLTKIESEYGISEFYKQIERAESMLRNSVIPETVKELIPTERSLVMLMPSALLPYLIHHFKPKRSFDQFCYSLLDMSSELDCKCNVTDMLVRAFFVDKDEEEKAVAEEAEVVEEERRRRGTTEKVQVAEKKGDLKIGRKRRVVDIKEEEMEEMNEMKEEMNEMKEEKYTTEFVKFPLISFVEDGSLNPDLVSFMDSIPGYKTYD